MSGTYEEFLSSLGQRESGGNYGAENRFHFLGKYQMGELALIDAGFVLTDGTREVNDYVGGWTGKGNVHSKEEFLASPQAQELAIRFYHKAMWGYLKSLRLDNYVGASVDGVLITQSGLLGAAHLVGQGKLKVYLESGGRTVVTDANGTTAREYLSKFSGYDISNVSGPTKPNIALPAAVAPAHFTKGIEEAFSKSKILTSPLILDLDGSGVSTTTVSAGTYFDHDHNGFEERTAWVASGDGLLVMDWNGDGRIDSGEELFGNQSRLPSNQLAANGFEALAVLDGNRDAQITRDDAAFAALQIWCDQNGDGEVDLDELHSLTELHIQAIQLGFATADTIDTSGNHHRQLGSFTFEDGRSGQVDDVWLTVDLADTVEASVVGISEEISNLPDLRGSGTVHSLRQAVAQDASGQLLAALQAVLEASDEGARRRLVEELIFHWTGVQELSPTSRGPNVDARELAAMEALVGSGFIQDGSRNNPGVTAGKQLGLAFEALADRTLAELDAQSSLSALYQLAIFSKDAGSTDFKVDIADCLAEIRVQIQENAGAGWSHLQDFTSNLQALGFVDESVATQIQAFANSLIPLRPLILAGLLLPVHNGTDGNDQLIGSLQDDRLVGYAGDDTLTGCDGHDLLDGGDGQDMLWGKGGNDLLLGGSGNDTLEGGSGDDELHGQGGDDRLDGGDGNDLYVFEHGFGHDTIHQYDSASAHIDIVRFTDDAASSVINLERTDNDLLLEFQSGDFLRVEGYFETSARRVDRFEFADGTTWDLDYIKAHCLTLGRDGADSITGYYGAGNCIYALGGDDRVIGGDKADFIVGGDGNDVMFGRAADDTMCGGEGDDFIYGESGNDKLDLGTGDDLGRGGTGDDWLIKGSGNAVVEGDTGNDRLTLGHGHMFLAGGAGSDTVETTDGVYVLGLNRGSGQDRVIASQDASITLSYGAGVAVTDLRIFKDGSDIVFDVGHGDKLRMDAVHAGDLHLAIQFLSPDGASYTANASDLSDVLHAVVAGSNLVVWSAAQNLSIFNPVPADAGALGGALAVAYAQGGTASEISWPLAVEILGAPLFGLQLQSGFHVS